MSDTTTGNDQSLTLSNAERALLVSALQWIRPNAAIFDHAELALVDSLLAKLEAAPQPAQPRWEPVVYSTFVEDQSHNDTYVLITLGGSQLEIGTDPTSNGVTVNLPPDMAVCRLAQHDAAQQEIDDGKTHTA